MRLLTHNTLRCNRKDVSLGFPLRIVPRQVEVRESPLNAEFIRRMVDTLDWSALVTAAAACGVDSLPPDLDRGALEDLTFVEALHRVLMDLHVVEGDLVCPESGQVFPIVNGIPNMKISEEDA
mmetsp:Transcript_22661/g.65971  ORF Transcript_22661/g.65971 Transcript_22661/m.65971 type:complete len:123 (-) Transcript_22661:313-681(-)